MSDWRDGYLAAVEEFLMKNGTFVSIEHYQGGRYRWADNDDPNEYSSWNCTYGWRAYDHYIRESTRKNSKKRSCPVTGVDMSTLRERSLSQFEGTFTDNKEEVGLEVRATCECGQYDGKWLRWVGTLSDILPAILGLEVTTYYGY